MTTLVVLSQLANRWVLYFNVGADVVADVGYTITYGDTSIYFEHGIAFLQDSSGTTELDPQMYGSVYLFGSRDACMFAQGYFSAYSGDDVSSVYRASSVLDPKLNSYTRIFPEG